MNTSMISFYKVCLFGTGLNYEKTFLKKLSQCINNNIRIISKEQLIIFILNRYIFTMKRVRITCETLKSHPYKKLNGHSI